MRPALVPVVERSKVLREKFGLTDSFYCADERGERLEIETFAHEFGHMFTMPNCFRWQDMANRLTLHISGLSPAEQRLNEMSARAVQELTCMKLNRKLFGEHRERRHWWRDLTEEEDRQLLLMRRTDRRVRYAACLATNLLLRNT